MIIEQNRQIVGSDIADEAINRVKEDAAERKEQEKKEGGTETDAKKTKRKRTTKTA